MGTCGPEGGSRGIACRDCDENSAFDGTKCRACDDTFVRKFVLDYLPLACLVCLILTILGLCLLYWFTVGNANTAKSAPAL